AEHVEAVLRRPEHDGGVMVPSLQGHAGVSGVAFKVFLVWLSLIERLLRDDFVLVQGKLSEGQRVAISVAEMLSGQTAVVHFSHLVFAAFVVEIVLVPVISAAPA